MTDKIEVHTEEQIYQWALGWREFDAYEKWTTEERILRCAARLIHEALLRESAQHDNTITIDELVAQLEADPEMKVAIDRERLWARGVRNDLEELRRDAERYRWLRNHYGLGNLHTADHTLICLYRVSYSGASQGLDRCIDAAIAAEREGP